MRAAIAVALLAGFAVVGKSYLLYLLPIAALFLITLFRAYGRYSDTHDATRLDRVFSQTYYQARQRFRVAAKDAKAELSAHVVCVDEVTGMDLTIDVAILRGTSPDNVLVHVSGTHGAEGYHGSAIQLQALHKWKKCAPTVVFVHALNPFGMAHYRRFNESNVDLNRNVLSAEKFAKNVARPPNQFDYETFTHLINPPHVLSFWDEIIFFPKAVFNIARFGFQRLKAALVTGQFHNQKGLYYAGTTQQPSHRIMTGVLREFITARRVVLIDVHSGLGPSGMDTLMVSTKAERELTLRVFPRHDEKFVEDESDKSGPVGGGAYANSGGYVAGYPDILFGNSEVHLGVTQEFGTVAPLEVVRAMVRENAAWNYARWTAVHREAAAIARDVFYVPKAAWKQSCLEKGEALLEQGVEFLSK